LLDILTLIGLTAALWVTVRSLTRFVKDRILTATGADRSLQEGIATLMQYGLIALGCSVFCKPGVWM
jgi:small-conductance mechanosensitive channel